MSTPTKVVVAILLTLSCVLAAPGPLLNAAPQTTDLKDLSEITNSQVSADGGLDAVLQRQKRKFTFNSYMRELYLNTSRLKNSNCTERFFDQTVSNNFCKSNKVVYSALRAPLEPSNISGNQLENYTYELCSNVSVDDDETILGHDFIIFKLPTEEVILEVYLFQAITNATVPWLDMVSYHYYNHTANTSGWQVFHLESRVYPVVSGQVCVIMYMREAKLSNETAKFEARLLNRTEMNEVFVLEEDINQPFASTFINGTITFPFFRKRSAEEPVFSRGSRAADCVLQEHTVSLNTYIPFNVVYPLETRLGMCARSQSSTYLKETAGENEPGYGLWGNSNEELHECAPVGFADLLVLADLSGTFALINIPEVVVTECGTV